MTLSPFIRELGRGARGSRSLSREQAFECFGAILDGQASDLEVGAFCVAMRIKGETPEELDGLLAATQLRCTPVATPNNRITVSLPSYNGARKLRLLTPLLAWALTQRGLSVLIHGHATADDRLTTEALFQVLGWPIHRERQALTEHQLAYYPLPTLCPSLSRLMDVRRVLGLRNSGHTVAKGLCLGSGPQLRVIAHTHGEFGALWSQWVESQGLTALLLRGTEGEPVADPRRSPSLHPWLQGVAQIAEPAPLARPSEFADPEWLGTDLDMVANWTQDIVRGKRPLPSSVAHQALVLSQLAQAAHAAMTSLPEARP